MPGPADTPFPGTPPGAAHAPSPAATDAPSKPTAARRLKGRERSSHIRIPKILNKKAAYQTPIPLSGKQGTTAPALCSRDHSPHPRTQPSPSAHTPQPRGMPLYRASIPPGSSTRAFLVKDPSSDVSQRTAGHERHSQGADSSELGSHPQNEKAAPYECQSNARGYRKTLRWRHTAGKFPDEDRIICCQVPFELPKALALIIGKGHRNLPIQRPSATEPASHEQTHLLPLSTPISADTTECRARERQCLVVWSSGASVLPTVLILGGCQERVIPPLAPVKQVTL